jgi:hypothetical protein
MSDSIALTTAEIYAKYQLPEILQKHLYRVTSLMAVVLDHWCGPELNQPLLIQTMLLHDLGNLVKFDLSDEAPFHLMSARERSFYQELQAQWHLKYGKDADSATCQLIRELGLKNAEAIIQLIQGHQADKLAETAAGEDWPQKLVDYTDFRVGPQGLVSLTQRFSDLTARYGYRHGEWRNNVQIHHKLTLFQTLETQLQTQLDCDLENLSEADLGDTQRFASFGFATSGILP